eukprot:XP_011604831.1 PREDICTED: involucrin-like [Takifugu rubripes]
MIGPHDASSALSILIILTGSSCLHLAMPNPNRIPGNVNDPHTDTLPRLLETLKKEDKEEEEEDLFKDMDPQTLAAVLVESLNHSQVAKKRDGKEQKEDVKVETVEGDKEYVNQDVPIMERADRDRQLELELMLAAQGKEQDKERENELKKALEEEEKVTEKVTSRTTSQDIHVQMEQLPKGPEEGVESQQDVSPREGPDSNEEEEQLSPEELKSLETMMQVFPRLNTVTKREQSLEQNERDIRDYSSYNDVIPLNKGNNLAMTKKKLKWQEETQKALNFPTFGSNFMDEFENNNYDGGKTEQLQNSVEQELLADDEPEENDSEDALSPEEEEARAKAEQEEMRRQAAEAQRAKMEEEKLADIASDMLLRYMGKQGNGNKKHSSNAMEDKRSDEEQERTPYPVYPYFFPPPLRSKPRFYSSQSSQSSHNFKGNSQDESYYNVPKKHLYSWVRPPPRSPPTSFQRKPYFSRYPHPFYPWTFQPILRPRYPPPVPAIPPQLKKYYYSASAHPAMANEFD